jgi:hypothetical protein
MGHGPDGPHAAIPFILPHACMPDIHLSPGAAALPISTARSFSSLLPIREHAAAWVRGANLVSQYENCHLGGG